MFFSCSLVESAKCISTVCVLFCCCLKWKKEAFAGEFVQSCCCLWFCVNVIYMKSDYAIKYLSSYYCRTFFSIFLSWQVIQYVCNLQYTMSEWTWIHFMFNEKIFIKTQAVYIYYISERKKACLSNKPKLFSYSVSLSWQHNLTPMCTTSRFYLSFLLLNNLILFVLHCNMYNILRDTTKMRHCPHPFL